MFNYSEKTVIDMPFKMLELFKTIKADKSVKSDAENVVEVKLTNTLSPSKTNMEASKNVKEIYVIDITLNSSRVPTLFLEALNKTISFQTLFRLKYKEKIKYITSTKIFEENKFKILKTFESDWLIPKNIEMPTTTKLEIVFKSMLEYVTGFSFRQEETFEQYIERISAIKRQKLEIERLTKLMNAEKQPNIKMSLNDKIKESKKELQKLDG